MRRFLIVFAKEPNKGTVKTRLKDCLSGSQRMNLYKAFLRDSIDIANRVECEKRIIAYESKIRPPRYLMRIAPSFVFYEQTGKNLGLKMYNAFEFALQKGASQAVIIGSDSPTLPASSIKKAFSLSGRADIVLGPSLDGGYYLIGLKSPCAGLFEGIAWSSSTVLKDTIKNAQRLKKKVALLDKRYDIDDANALSRLKNDLSKLKDRTIARWTRKFISSVSWITDKNNKMV